MNKYVYDNLTIENTKELMEMLNFLLDNDMISITEYDWWEDNTTISLQLKSDLLTLALNDIENMLDDLYNDRDIDKITRGKKARYIKYIRLIIEKHLYILLTFVHFPKNLKIKK